MHFYSGVDNNPTDFIAESIDAVSIL